MTKGLDVAKMEAAFKRAAHKAVHGTREERSGKFMPKQDSGAAPASSQPDRPSKQLGLRRSKSVGRISEA